MVVGYPATHDRKVSMRGGTFLNLRAEFHLEQWVPHAADVSSLTPRTARGAVGERRSDRGTRETAQHRAVGRADRRPQAAGAPPHRTLVVRRSIGTCAEQQ